MKYSVKLLQSFFASPLPAPKEIASALMMRAFEVEHVEKKRGDTLLDVAILPNRADCMSHLGIARELSAIFNLPLRIPSGKLAAKAVRGEKPLHIEIQDAGLVPRYAALRLRGVKNGPSSAWMKAALKTLEINSISALVDITNYVMEELGQPLHAFDVSAIQNSRMTIRRSVKGERIETLEGIERDLVPGILVIESGGRLIDLAGIKGGKESGVSSGTTDVLLQAAVFDQKAIYRAKKLLGFTTPAADRYAHGVDPEGAMAALERAARLIQEVAGGRIVQRIDAYPNPAPRTEIVFDGEKAARVLGVKLPQNEMLKILRRIGCSIAVRSGTIRVTVPSWRRDLRENEDLAEEIGRLYGYEHVHALPPVAELASVAQNAAGRQENAIRETLRAAGFAEIYGYSFIGERDLELLSYSLEDRESLVEIEKPLSEDYKYLRPSLVDALLKSASKNVRGFPNDDLLLFEIGTAFSRTIDGIRERTVLSCLLAPRALNPRPFYSAKGIAERLLALMGIRHTAYEEIHGALAMERLSLLRLRGSAEIRTDVLGCIGILGTVSDRVTASLKIPREIALLSLDLNRLVPVARDPHEFTPPSRFPGVFRDIALSVPRTTKAAEIERVIRGAAGNLLQNLELFDVYEGNILETGKKSMAFHMMFRAEDRTLTSAEIEEVCREISRTLEQNSPWSVRD